RLRPGEGVGRNDRREAAVLPVLVRDYLAAHLALPALLEDAVLDPRGEVEPAVVVAIGGVGRDIDLPRSQREPADRPVALHAERQAELRAAQEGDQCRGIDGPLRAVRRDPEPAVVAVRPAAIVIGSEAPGLL